MLQHWGYYQFSDGLRVEPTTVTLRGGVKLLTPSLPSAPLPRSNYKAQTTERPSLGSRKRKWSRQQGPCTTTTMIMVRGRRRRRQEDKETTTTGVDTTMVCHRVCDYHHYHMEEEERQTTMVTTTGDRTLGEGRHYDTTTTTITATQDRLQERSEKRTMTSSDYIIRLTDRLLRIGSKISDCFSQICTVFPHFLGPFQGWGGGGKTKICGQEFYGHPDFSDLSKLGSTPTLVNFSASHRANK